ncbi:MAG: GYD domain-containing protein [bacterium]
MPTYVILFSWTQKGIENIKESPSRLEAAKKVCQAAGGELKEFYSTTGRYDGLVVLELPDDEAAAKVALATGSAGAVRTETLRAFTEDEYRKIIAALP